MSARSDTNALCRTDQTGFGLGLRTAHYADFLRQRQPLDWLEIITDNFLGEGGKPLAMLDRIRRDYPVAMHGVAMSIGGTDPLDLDYLRQVRQLADRIEPLWVSDHLCWTGQYHHRLHDLYPLPYTEESAQHVIARIRQAQDILGRRLVIENVSSYIDFVASARTEWEFLHHVATEADCLLLVDVNNIYVSSVNHGFDAVSYLQGLPGNRVQQIHLAGHSNHGDHLIDTHDQPVDESVWQLYAHACRLFGPVATMIERDDHIPAMAVLLEELDRARQTRRQAYEWSSPPTEARTSLSHSTREHERASAPSLHLTQQTLIQYVLTAPQEFTTAQDLVVDGPSVGAARRLAIYHHAYRARLVDALVDTFARTALYAGSEDFALWASDYVEQHTPTERSLSHYGEALPEFLERRFPHNPELFELAQLDWDLRSRFDMADTPALDRALAAELPPESWLQANDVLHPSVVLRTIRTNVVALWQALDSNAEVPTPETLDVPLGLVVWRLEYQPHFHTVDTSQLSMLSKLAEGYSLSQACNEIAEDCSITTEQLGQWLQNALEQRWLRA